MFILDSTPTAVTAFNNGVGKIVSSMDAFFANLGNFFDTFFKSYIGWVMIGVAILFCINAIFAFKASEIARKRGYDEDGYLSWGFFFGIFVLIRASLLKNRLNAR